MLPVLIPAAILGLIVFGLVSLRGRGGADLAPRGWLGLYLYLASLAGVLVFVVGVASLVNVAFAVTAGNDFTYGHPPDISAFTPPACPPNTPECEAIRARELAVNPRDQMLAQRDRRRGDDLVRGATFTVFGAVLWAAHWLARRTFGADGGPSPFRRGYLMAGTVLFGLLTTVLLPWGIYQALAGAILPPAPDQFSSGIADTLGGGLAALPLWLIYLRLVVRELRSPESSGSAA
ncbi:MAG: DUF5671 domain-containing protein [Chloroflexota bacterium]|nr:DUF5671 domain-containing protein [Chloroflexota bacterium]